MSVSASTDTVLEAITLYIPVGHQNYMDVLSPILNARQSRHGQVPAIRGMTISLIGCNIVILLQVMCEFLLWRLPAGRATPAGYAQIQNAVPPSTAADTESVSTF